MGQEKKKKNSFRICGLYLFMMLFIASYQLFAEEGTTRKNAGKVLQVEGNVLVQPYKSTTWKIVVPGTCLYPGDILRTGENGWTSILLSDESMVQLNKNSVLVLKHVGKRAGWIQFSEGQSITDSTGTSHYFLKKGHLWLRNKNRSREIKIDTPYVSTSIRGTELDIRIDKIETAVISVLEGSVKVEKKGNHILINGLEQVVVKPGHPFERLVLISPVDVVQWTLSLYPFIESFFLTPTGAVSQSSMGWVHLRKGNWDKALDAFKNNSEKNPETYLGMSLSKALQRDIPASLAILTQLKKKWPDYGPAWMFESLLLLLRNSGYETVLESAREGVRLSPLDPLSHVILAYAYQYGFYLDHALVATQKAIALEKKNVTAITNLSRLYFAKGDLQKSLESVKIALKIDPLNSQALNLRGFLLLAMHRTDAAKEIFEQAAIRNPYLGEPRLGLALYYMRKGEQKKAFEQITISVLLEPQRAIFLSYWAKMLYEAKRFKESLDILALAERIDPKDPTPLLYRALILSDLNRVHEAISSLQSSISLNDNRAVYRSRFLLDRDLAVKNVNLAILFKKLGVSEWGSVKAMNSLKNDYTNFSAQNFVADQLDYLQGASSFSARSARLKSFLMQPANLNTLNSFNEYTSFFEKPDIGMTLKGASGNMDYWDTDVAIYGALPQIHSAFRTEIEGLENKGFKDHDVQKYKEIDASFKWDITYKDTLSFRTRYSETDIGDLSSQTQYDEKTDPENKSNTSLGDISLGFFRQMHPGTNFFFHIKRQYRYDKLAKKHMVGSSMFTEGTYSFDYFYDYHSSESLDDPYTSVQMMQHFRFLNHQINTGVLFYESDRAYHISEKTLGALYLSGTDILVDLTETPNEMKSTRVKQYSSYYFQDSVRMTPSFTFECALYADTMKNVNSKEDLSWRKWVINPRLGIIVSPTKRDTIRFSYFKHLDPFDTLERIDAIDVAGHILPTFYEGAVIEEYAASYEHEWSRGIIMAKGFVNKPMYEFKTAESGMPVFKEYNNRYHGYEVALNQLLLNDIAFSSGYVCFNIKRDQVTPLLEGSHHWLWGRLTKVHPKGIIFSLGVSYYNTDYDDTDMDDSDFLNIASFVKYEFPFKRGSARFEVNNLLDAHFNGVFLSDTGGVLPKRFYSFIVELYF